MYFRKAFLLICDYEKIGRSSEIKIMFFYSSHGGIYLSNYMYDTL